VSQDRDSLSACGAKGRGPHADSPAVYVSAEGKQYGTKEDVWSDIQENIKNKLGMQRYSIWFKQTELMEIASGQVLVGVPNVIIQQYLQSKYRDPVAGAIQELLGERFEVNFDIAPRLFRKMRAQQQSVAVGGEFEQEELSPVPAESPLAARGRAAGRDAFEGFVATESNMLPYVASREIALSGSPGFRFLLLWGGHGLGKSSLLHAIHHAARCRRENRPALYTTAENWCNEYYCALQAKAMRNFRGRYRSCVLLLIDDIQYLQGRPGAQSELMHTVKHLLSSRHKVVLSADRHPDELGELAPALRCVLRGAFWARLVLPGARERVEIVTKLAEQFELCAEAEVHEFIARKHGRNLQELHSAVQSLRAYAMLQGKHAVDMPFALEAFAAMARLKEAPIELEDIANEVEEAFQISPERLRGPSRLRRLCRARRFAMYLARELTDKSLAEIGRFFGGRTHSTVKYALNKMAGEKKNDRSAVSMLESLAQRLRTR